MSQLIPLQLLRPAETARIMAVEGDVQQITRLHEMGLREGEFLQMVQPGEPCIIALGNHRLTFRGNDSASIFVTVCDTAHSGADHVHP